VHDAVVVGGGIAGLAAAWRLRDRDVVVLEAAERIGGRIYSERRGPYWLNFGAHVFAGAGTATDGLLRETGVRAVPVPGVLTALELSGRVVARGRIETYPLRLPLAFRDRVAFLWVGARLRLAVAAYDRVMRTGDQQRILAYRGDRTFSQWLGRVPAPVDAVLRPTLQRSSAEPEELAAGYGIGYFHLVWDRSSGLARNILGGPATLPERIAGHLGARVRTRCRVTEVVQERDAVRVVHERGEERARYAVVATPAHVTRALVAGLPDETRDALAQVVYGPYVVAAFATNEERPTPWDGIYAVAVARRSFNMLFNSANVLRTGAREPGGSLMVYSGASLGRRLWDVDDEEVAATYLADLDGVFPGVGALVAETVVHRWEHGLPYVRPGRHRIQSALERPLGRVVLAGDYLGTRYTDTSIRTGFEAGEAVRRHVDEQRGAPADVGRSPRPACPDRG
jgi:oxygen-dependent protoporphyrinogen oxidase